jgi:hypothetical protein
MSAWTGTYAAEMTYLLWKARALARQRVALHDRP